MTLHAGSAVWIDHQEARILHVNTGGIKESVINAPAHHIHRHPKGSTDERHRSGDANHFFAAVAKALESAEKILVIGPSIAKLQFLRYLREHSPALEARVVGIETSDHPTDPQLIAHIKHHFGVADRKR
jgi:stalled ribosome rescue protein Dom34